MTIPDMSRVRWRKSSFSSQNGNCVEVADWRRASHSGNNGNCVEAGTAGQAVAVRDSQDPEGPCLVFEPSAWRTFAVSVKAGDFEA
jgi:hypothetical protein